MKMLRNHRDGDGLSTKYAVCGCDSPPALAGPPCVRLSQVRVCEYRVAIAFALPAATLLLFAACRDQEAKTSSRNASGGASLSQPVLLEHDLGRVSASEPRSHLFEIRNRLSVPISIVTIEKSCSCISCDVVVGDYIKPGLSKWVRLSISPGRTGGQAALLKISANAKGFPDQVFLLRLSAEIQQEIWTEPSKVVIERNEFALLRLCFRNKNELPAVCTAEAVRGNVTIVETDRCSEFIEFTIAGTKKSRAALEFDAIVFRYGKEQYPKHQVAVTLLEHELAGHDIKELDK